MGEIETKENFALGIFVFSMLTLVFISFFVFRGEVTGNVVNDIPTNENQIGNVAITCSDSDGGLNEYIKGTVNYCVNGKCSKESDYCSGKILTDFYCEDNEKKSEEHECKFDCDNGVCLELAKDYEYYGGGRSGGGGVRGSGTTTSTNTLGETYDLNELNSENTLEIVKYDKINFKISGNQYILNLDEITETQVKMSISGNLITLNTGEDINLDLNNDEANDLYIRLRSISIVNGKVKLTLNLA
jgi:hypothetical protein